jgi:tetratricopeptide (TPR) repeat protein
VEYYAGLRNVVIQFAASLFGLDPGKDVGVEKMERAAAEGQWSWIEANGILSFVYLWIDPNPDLALKHSSKLVVEFPKNFYFRILYTESLIRSGEMNSALTSLNTLKKMFPDLTEIQKSWYYGYLQYEFALYHFLTGDNNKAMIYVNESVEKYGAELDIILANAWVLKGQIHDLKQERKAAVSAYKKCVDLDNYTFVINDAKNYLKTPYRK